MSPLDIAAAAIAAIGLLGTVSLGIYRGLVVIPRQRREHLRYRVRHRREHLATMYRLYPTASPEFYHAPDAETALATWARDLGIDPDLLKEDDPTP